MVNRSKMYYRPLRETEKPFHKCVYEIVDGDEAVECGAQADYKICTSVSSRQSKSVCEKHFKYVFGSKIRNDDIR